MAVFNLLRAVAARGLNANADSVSGALFYVFEEETTTPVTTYTDSTGDTANAHPVVADSSGSWDGIYVPPGRYKVDIRTPGGASLPGYPIDNVVVDDATNYATRAAVAAATVSGSETFVVTAGYATAGDGGGDTYYAVGSDPGSVRKVQSANGQWFQGVPDDMVDIRRHGLTGSGDETTAFNAALATGEDLWIPQGVTISVTGATGFANNQRIWGAGTLKKFGTSDDAMLVVDDEASGVWIDGIILDGNLSAFTDPYDGGNPARLILGHLIDGFRLTNATLQNAPDSAVTFRDSKDVEVSGCRFVDCIENGVEIRNYVNDPRTALAYSGTRPAYEGGHKVVGNYFERIGRKETGAGGLVDGTCATFDSVNSSYPMINCVFDGNVCVDALRGAFSEQNTSGCEAKNMQFTNNFFFGGITGKTDGGWGKTAFAMIGVHSGRIGANTVLNSTNYKDGTDDFTAVVISASNGDTTLRDVRVEDNVIADDTGDSDRMAYAIRCAVGGEGNTIARNNVRGGRLAQIFVASGTVGIEIEDNPGGDAQFSWGPVDSEYFTVTDISASETDLAMTHQPAGLFTAPVAAYRQRWVGLQVQLSEAVTAGSISFTPVIDGSDFSAIAIDQDDLAGGLTFVNSTNTNGGAGQLVEAGETFQVHIDTDSGFLPDGSMDIAVRAIFVPAGG